MRLKYFATSTEFKLNGDSGAISGYAAIFGNRDEGGDTILHGAFQKFTRTGDGKTRMLYQHDQRSPIGKADVSQDGKGLHFDGQLMLGDPTARKAHSQIREGLIDSMSIGYDILPGGAQTKGDTRELSALHLFEISPVTFPMNPLARIETVKSAMDCDSVRELEHLLREQLGLSSRKAKVWATTVWPLLDRDGREAEGDCEGRVADVIAAMADELKQINLTLTTRG